MTLRGILAAQEAFNRSAWRKGQCLALLGFLHSSESRSLTYWRMPRVDNALRAFRSESLCSPNELPF